jgi:hypothetical protein
LFDFSAAGRFIVVPNEFCNTLDKASGLENQCKPNAMKLASMAEAQPGLST